MQKHHDRIVGAVEQNKLTDACKWLVEYAQAQAPEQVAAARLQGATLREIEQEELLFGRTAGLRQRRAQLRLTLLKLAETIKGQAAAGGSTLTEEQRTGLLVFFRAGDWAGLFGHWFTLVGADHPAYPTLLLLEQDWKALREAELQNLDTPQSIAVRQSQLRKRILEQINKN